MKRYLLFVTTLLLVQVLMAQTNTSTMYDSVSNTETLNDTTAGIVNELPMGFMDIQLGASVDDVKAVLRESDLFLYRERDFLSLASSDNLTLTVQGNSYIDNAYFIFNAERMLKSINIFLDTTVLDYVTLYKLLSSKYGRPRLRVNNAKWENDILTLILDAPLSITYVLMGNEEQVTLPSARVIEERKIYSLSKDEFLSLF